MTTGPVTLVTGAAYGIGQALALLLDPRLGRVSGSVLAVDGGLHLHPAPAGSRAARR